MLSRLVIAFHPRSKHLLISWLQSPSTTYIYMCVYMCTYTMFIIISFSKLGFFFWKQGCSLCNYSRINKIRKIHVETKLSEIWDFINIEGQTIYILAFPGHKCLSQLLILLSCESSHRLYTHEWACLCARKALFTATVGGLVLAAGCSLPTLDVICNPFRFHQLPRNVLCDILYYSAAFSCCAPLVFQTFLVLYQKDTGKWKSPFPLVEVLQEAATWGQVPLLYRGQSWVSLSGWNWEIYLCPFYPCIHPSSTMHSSVQPSTIHPPIYPPNHLKSQELITQGL